jgi:hypothetical protein
LKVAIEKILNGKNGKNFSKKEEEKRVWENFNDDLILIESEDPNHPIIYLEFRTFGRFRTVSAGFERFRTVSNGFGQFRTVSAGFGRFGRGFGFGQSFGFGKQFF